MKYIIYDSEKSGKKPVPEAIAYDVRDLEGRHPVKEGVEYKKNIHS